MGRFQSFLLSLVLVLPLKAASLDQLSDDEPLQLPPVGAYQLRVLTPALLELTLITTKATVLTPIRLWNFVDRDGRAQLPTPQQFSVSATAKNFDIKTVGFKRRVLYAPLKERDLRIASYLYLELTEPIPDRSSVEVRNPDQKLWAPEVKFTAGNDPFRWSPALHVNQTGYMAPYSKKAMVGYYLGNLGELNLPPRRGEAKGGASEPVPGFMLLEADSGKEVFRGALVLRPDKGFPFPSYQSVFEADFTTFKTPGEFRLFVPGLGTSYPFFIDDGIAGAFARTYALGIYHQRCGTDNALPFTRFTHASCHTAPAEVPDSSGQFASVNSSLGKESANFKENSRHTAPQLKNVSSSLYPFINHGPIDVRGGHHDAGDYSKYTINSAAFIHHLVFAADAFPGVSSLDNLGLPESGDGKSDVLQEAKQEADFLAKMQDADGGFYFLVYPRDREYENNVTPDKGDPQIVFPKNTAVTAAATAALAQCASSPVFKRQFPEAAATYLAKAKKGWDFLQRAIAKYGKDGAYQKITHYGDEFMHDDELAWAACELYLATGEPMYQQKLIEWFNPGDPNTRRWGWWRLYDSYGCAIRSYAFGARTGRLKRGQLSPPLLEGCENEIAAAGDDQLRRAEDSAYGSSFPEETKRVQSAGWYFSSDAAFDLAVAYQLDYPQKKDPRPKMLEAIVSNLNYEQGCNPVNVVYLTGLGWKRQREIVHQFAQNDRRVLPPSGIPLGNIQAGFGWNNVYEQELDKLSFPSDGAKDAPYPFYDRWGDGFNLSQEFVIVNQARALGYCAWLMARSSLKAQSWNSALGRITGWSGNPSSTSPVTLTLTTSGVELSSARVVWEADARPPVFGSKFILTPGNGVPRWVEAEAQLPDGRRVFGVLDLPNGRNNGASR
jgi:hypothetical protein